MTNSTLKELFIVTELSDGREVELATTNTNMISYYAKVLRGKKIGDVVSVGLWNDPQGDVKLSVLSWESTRRMDITLKAAGIREIDNPYLDASIFDAGNSVSGGDFDL